MVKHWQRFPREVVDASALETFKDILSNQILLKISLLTAVTGLSDLVKVLYNPNDSMNVFMHPCV